MTATLTITPTSANISPPATSRCGLNETGICCKESETPHSRVTSTHPDYTARSNLRWTLTLRQRPERPAAGGIRSAER
jgi:hypothetical protein